MTQRELKAMYNYTLKVEAATDAVTARPFTDAFKTVWRFIATVSWYKWTLGTHTYIPSGEVKSTRTEPSRAVMGEPVPSRPRSGTQASGGSCHG